jgi:hypothetical protein
VLLNKNLKINDPERKKRLLNWYENTAKKTNTNAKATKTTTKKQKYKNNY